MKKLCLFHLLLNLYSNSVFTYSRFQSLIQYCVMINKQNRLKKEKTRKKERKHRVFLAVCLLCSPNLLGSGSILLSVSLLTNVIHSVHNSPFYLVMLFLLNCLRLDQSLIKRSEQYIIAELCGLFCRGVNLCTSAPHRATASKWWWELHLTISTLPSSSSVSDLK